MPCGALWLFAQANPGAAAVAVSEPHWQLCCLLPDALASKHVAPLPCVPTLSCRVRTIVFDKTGTLTAGKPHVVDVRVLHSPLDVGDVIQLAAAVEAHSEHPIASALLGLLRHQQQQGKATDGGNGGISSSGGRGDYGTDNWGCGGGGAAATVLGAAAAPLPPLLQVRDVEVTVGQGISGWVQLPPPAPAAAAVGKSSSSSGSSGGSLNRQALLAIQASAAGGSPTKTATAATAGTAAGVAAAAQQPASGESRFGLSSLLAVATAGLGDQAAPVPATSSAGAGAGAGGPAEVLVIVGNKRLMTEAGVAVPPAAEAYMRDQDVRANRCCCRCCCRCLLLLPPAAASCCCLLLLPPAAHHLWCGVPGRQAPPLGNLLTCCLPLPCASLCACCCCCCRAAAARACWWLCSKFWWGW